MKKPLLIVLSLLCSPCAQALVYKCVDENGRTRYQAAVCAGVVVPIDETPHAAPVAPARPFDRDSGGGRHAARSEAKKNLFKSLSPCPSTGETRGPCPGYVVDHVKPLACGGADDPRNMQWQTVAAGKAKDQWERLGCQPALSARGGLFPRARHFARSAPAFPAGARVYTGPRGGQFTLTENGRKHYLGAGADGGG